MKKLLEAINRGILKGLNESNINLLADLDDELEDSMQIKHKNINTNSEKDIIVSLLKNIIYKFNDITFDEDYYSTTIQNITSTINNPDNFCEYAGVIKANNKDHLKELIEIGQKLFGKEGNFNWIDTSRITDMSKLFYDLNFNGHIELWDVSNVTDMFQMFCGDEVYTSQFNQPIGGWDVSNVTNMCAMFEESRFNQDISNWNVSNVNNMAGMFYNAYKFNQPIDNWDVSNVTDMEGMFYEAKSFNQPIGNWDVSNVTDMGGMFYGAKSFNQDISNWHIKNNTETSSMFEYCPIKDEYKPNKANIL